MALALRLARKGMGRTSPNPMVGAVVVNDGRIVGQGSHRRAGAPHAEVMALRQAGAAARGATLYCTLEPCNHFGRTPPCCEAIVSSGVSEVVVATRDPNPITNGRGLVRLRRAGIRVLVGVLAEEARDLNAAFFKVMRTGLPSAIAKAGQSLDGKIATVTGESRWITSPASRAVGHQWRSRVDAILVGLNTVMRDDPDLTVRAGPRRASRPVKVILDSRLRTPLTARCLASPPATLIATISRNHARQAAFARRGVEVVSLRPAGRRGRPDGHSRVPLRPLFRLLARRGLHSVLIEGGGEALAGALAERLVDRVIFCIAPLLIGGRAAPSSVGGEGIRRLSRAVRLSGFSCSRVGADLCVEARVVYPAR